MALLPVLTARASIAIVKSDTATMVLASDWGGGFSTSTMDEGRLIVNGGTLYVGSGGIILSGTGAFTQSTTLSGGAGELGVIIAHDPDHRHRQYHFERG